jgi:hypothetical protein
VRGTEARDLWPLNAKYNFYKSNMKAAMDLLDLGQLSALVRSVK